MAFHGVSEILCACEVESNRTIRLLRAARVENPCESPVRLAFCFLDHDNLPS